MFYIILSWIYITAISFTTGSLLTHVLKKLFRTKDETLHLSFVCMNGLLLTSFIVSVWLLLGKVDFMANAFIFLLGVFSYLFLRHHIHEAVKRYIQAIRQVSPFLLAVFVFFVLILASVSYIPSSHADDVGAFSPLIKWIQEFGAVPGISNLDARFGYNSSWFNLQALYGFSFLNVGLFNDLNGLLFLYALVFSIQGIHHLLQGMRSPRAYLQAFFFLPVLFLYYGISHDVFLYSIHFFTSPTYDIPVTFMMWLMFFMLLDLKHEESFAFSLKAHLVIIYIAYLVTIKLNAVPLGIIGLFILGRMLWERKFGRALALVLTGFCLILPWMMKTIISSGYLLFPFSGLDLLDVDWKMPGETILYIENSVTTWAIDPEIYTTGEYLNDKKKFSVPVTEWFHVWYRKLNFNGIVLFYGTLLSLSGFLIWVASGLIRQKNRFIKNHIIEIVLGVTLFAGLLLWFLKGPLPRYGFSYLVFTCIAFFSYVTYWFLRDVRSVHVGRVVVIYLLIASMYYFNYVGRGIPQHFLGNPKEMHVPPYSPLEVGNGKWMYIVDGPHCGNAPLPSSARFIFDHLKPMYRGESIKDGFIHQRHPELRSKRIDR